MTRSLLPHIKPLNNPLLSPDTLSAAKQTLTRINNKAHPGYRKIFVIF